MTVVGVADCLIIYPDGYTGTKVTDENRTTLYNDSSTWAEAQNAGVVCITPVKADTFRPTYWILPDNVLQVCGGDSAYDLTFWWLSAPETTNASRPVTEVK